MAFAISAFFPLGFYQGSDSGGRPESYPSPSRLYSALVSAAYLTFGFSFHIVVLTAISVSAVTKVSPRPRLNHMRMHEILRWRICFRCFHRRFNHGDLE